MLKQRVQKHRANKLNSTGSSDPNTSFEEAVTPTEQTTPVQTGKHLYSCTFSTIVTENPIILGTMKHQQNCVKFLCIVI